MAPPHPLAGGTSTQSGRSIYNTAALCETPSVPRAPLHSLISLLLLACGAGPETSAPPPPELVEGAGVYVLRYNPPPCLRGEPGLDAELDTHLGWERVALEKDTPESRALAALEARFRQAPGSMVRVRGVVSDDVRPYGDDHVARVLRLQALDPPKPEPDAIDDRRRRPRLAGSAASPAGRPGCARPAATGSGRRGSRTPRG